MNKLTEKQEDVLNALLRHKFWCPISFSWVWDTPSGTRRILNVLVKKGYAEIQKDGEYHLDIFTIKEGENKLLMIQNCDGKTIILNKQQTIKILNRISEMMEDE